MVIKQAEYFKSFIQDTPDFPKKGILFHDMFPLLGNAEAFSNLIENFKKNVHARVRTGDLGCVKDA